MKLPARAALILASVIAAFTGYLMMARTMPINADGASDALQAWDMWHGNPLLQGWTLTDVSFYTTELIQIALIELVTGLNEEVFRIATAMTYTLLVLFTALLAKGDATGRRAAVRIGIAVAIVLLPMPGSGYLVAFGGSNHLGTGVVLVFIWLILDRFQAWRWIPVAVGLLLAWAQIADPLVLFIGVAPLALISFYRAVRAREWKGKDAQLVLAAALSVGIGKAAHSLITAAGGYAVHEPPTDFASPSKWFGHLKLLGEVMAVNYGGYLPEMKNPVDFAVAILRLAGLALALAAVVVALISLLRKPGGDRINQILGMAIAVNLAAFVASTLPTDLMSARQVVATLPMGAVLAGRIWGERLQLHKKLVPLGLAVILAFFGAVFIGHSAGEPFHEPKRDLVAWLDTQGLHHGLGGYWTSNDLTLISEKKVVVAPITGATDIKAYHWESHEDWYNPALSDARFIVIDTSRPAFGTLDNVLKQFGQPVRRQDFEQYAVLVYDYNLLGKLASG